VASVGAPAFNLFSEGLGADEPPNHSKEKWKREERNIEAWRGKTKRLIANFWKFHIRMAQEERLKLFGKEGRKKGGAGQQRRKKASKRRRSPKRTGGGNFKARKKKEGGLSISLSKGHV